MTEYYKPEIVKESPLAIDYNDPEIAGDKTLTALLDGAKDGMIKIQLEHDVILQRISRDLYKHASSGFRELYVNAVSHGCKKAKSLYGESVKPRIEITLNVQDRRLIIHDIDATGISVDVFKKIYCVAGRSGNFDSQIAGQFGLGRLAYMCLSDIVIIETWSRATDERYTVIGKSGLGYQPIKAKPALEKPGTRITLTLREEIEIKDLLKYIDNIARYSGIDTFLTIDKDIVDRYDSRKYAAGTTQIGYSNISLKDIVDSDPTWRAIEIDNSDYYFYGAWKLGRNSDQEIQARYGGHEVLLCSVPVEFDLSVPFSASILNIKDERKFKPTPDRERLSENAEQEIRTRLTADLKDRLAFINEIKTVSDYRKCDFKPLLDQVIGSYGNRLLTDWTNQEVQTLMSRLGMSVSTNNWSSENMPLKRIIANSSVLSLIVAIPQWSSKKIELVQEHNPDAIFIKFKQKQALTDSNVIQQLQELGITTLDECVRANSLGFKRGPARKAIEITDIAIHESSTYSYSYSRFEKRSAKTERIDIDIAKEHSHLIIARKKTDQYIDIIRHVSTRYEITKSNVKDQLPDALTIDQFVASKQKQKVQTSAGKMTIAKLAKIVHADIELWNYDDPDLGALVKPNNANTIIITGSGDLLFEIAACLTHAGKTYTIDTYMHDIRDKIDNASNLAVWYENYFINDSHYVKAGDSDLIGAALHLTLLIQKAGPKHAQLIEIVQDGMQHHKSDSHAGAYVKYVKGALMPVLMGDRK